MSGTQQAVNTAFVANQAASSISFLDSIGINGPSNAATASMLSYLGINHLRTGLTTASSLLAAGADGAKMDVILPWYLVPINTDTLKSFLTQMDATASVVEAIEGPNEVNEDPDSFEGLTGAAGIEAEQKQIYALVKADTTLNNAIKSTAVYNFTVLQGTPAGTYGDMSAYADSMNLHAYGGAGAQPSWIFPYETSQYRVAGKPLVMTETGATTIATTGVTEVRQAQYDIKALLDSYNLNVSRTYLYNLQDWESPSDTTDFSAHYGLYNLDGSIKLAGTAIHNFTTILSQTAPGAVGTVDTLSYSLSGLPYYGKAELFSKAGGAFDLVMWNETADWNATTGSAVTIPTNHITLTLANKFESITVYDPLISASPIAAVSNASSITLDLNDDPLIIELVPIGTAARTAAFLNLDAPTPTTVAPTPTTVAVTTTTVAATITPTASSRSPVTLLPAIKIITGNWDGGVTLAGNSAANSTVTVSDKVGGVTTVLGSAVTSSTGAWSLTSHAAVNMAVINSYSVLASDQVGGTGSMAGQFLLASTGVDTLTGRSGAADVFAIMSFKGSGVIKGFETSALAGAVHDVIDFSGRGITSFGQVQSMLSGTSSSVITIGSGKTITLADVATTSLTASDFRYS